jgi:hypothetical protein
MMSAAENRSTATLVAAARTGGQAAFAVLITRHYPIVSAAADVLAPFSAPELPDWVPVSLVPCQPELPPQWGQRP